MLRYVVAARHLVSFLELKVVVACQGTGLVLGLKQIYRKKKFFKPFQFTSFIVIFKSRIDI